jgi:hypothetical protein
MPTFGEGGQFTTLNIDCRPLRRSGEIVTLLTSLHQGREYSREYSLQLM